MKTKTVKKKLVFNKSTVANLSKSGQSYLYGGGVPAVPYSEEPTYCTACSYGGTCNECTNTCYVPCTGEECDGIEVTNELSCRATVCYTPC